MLYLARQLSEVLTTRCFAIEVTDDSYGYGLFDRGEIAELAIFTIRSDLGRIFPRLGLPAPPPVEGDEEVFHFQSNVRDPSKTGPRCFRGGAARRDLRTMSI